MTIPSLLVLLLIIAVVLAVVPADARFKNLIYVVTVVLVIVMLVRFLFPGILPF